MEQAADGAWVSPELGGDRPRALECGCSGSPTGSPATATRPRTSPRRSSSGSSARSTRSVRARSRAGCIASPRTSSSTRRGGGAGSASSRCRRTPTTGWPVRCLAPDLTLRRPDLRRRHRDRAARAQARVPGRGRALRRGGAVVRGDQRGPRRQDRHRSLAHPPWTLPAAHRTAAPSTDRDPAPRRRCARPRPRGRAVVSHLHHKVSALIDGELSPGARARALAHARRCAQCRRGDRRDARGQAAGPPAGPGRGRRRPARCGRRRLTPAALPLPTSSGGRSSPVRRVLVGVGSLSALVIALAYVVGAPGASQAEDRQAAGRGVRRGVRGQHRRGTAVRPRRSGAGE